MIQVVRKCACSLAHNAFRSSGRLLAPSIERTIHSRHWYVSMQLRNHKPRSRLLNDCLIVVFQRDWTTRRSPLQPAVKIERRCALKYAIHCEWELWRDQQVSNRTCESSRLDVFAARRQPTVESHERRRRKKTCPKRRRRKSRRTRIVRASRSQRQTSRSTTNSCCCASSSSRVWCSKPRALGQRQLRT